MCQSSNPYLDKLNLDYPSGVKETEEDHEESPSVIEKRQLTEKSREIAYRRP